MHEIVLRSTLKVSEIKSFCGAVPSLESLCAAAGISSGEDEETIWAEMVKRNLFMGEPYWIEDRAAERVINAVAKRFHDRLLALASGEQA